MSYQPPASPPRQTPPAGWFIDPEDGSQHRYWDGHAWTEHRSQRADPSGGLRSPGRLIGDAFALARRQWQPITAAVAVGSAGQAAAAVLLFVTLNSVFDGLLAEIFNQSQDTFGPATDDLDVSVSGLAPLVVGVALMWAAASVMRAAVPHTVAEDLAGRPVSAGSALAHGLGRALRVAGLDMRIGLLAFAVMLVVVVPSTFVPLLALLLFPAWMVAVVYASVVTSLAYTAVSVTVGEPPLRHALSLTRGHFWKLFGRLLLVGVVAYVGVIVVSMGLFAVAAVRNGSVVAMAVVLVLYVLVAMAAAMVTAVAASLCYCDLDAATDTR